MTTEQQPLVGTNAAVEAVAAVAEAATELLVYCFKCKTKNRLVEGEVVPTKNGRQRLAGKCEICGCKQSLMMKAGAEWGKV